MVPHDVLMSKQIQCLRNVFSVTAKSGSNLPLGDCRHCLQGRSMVIYDSLFIPLTVCCHSETVRAVSEHKVVDIGSRRSALITGCGLRFTIGSDYPSPESRELLYDHPTSPPPGHEHLTIRISFSIRVRLRRSSLAHSDRLRIQACIHHHHSPGR